MCRSEKSIKEEIMETHLKVIESHEDSRSRSGE